jgi:hypothetical protein
MSVIPSTAFTDEIMALITGDTPHVALYTANPADDGSGAEVAGGSYARQDVTFGAVSNKSMSNNAMVSFTGLPAATITHWGIKDAVTGGNLKVYGVLDQSITTIAGDEVNFPIGNLVVTIAGS